MWRRSRPLLLVLPTCLIFMSWSEGRDFNVQFIHMGGARNALLGGGGDINSF